jgi:RimJ/RimL family protein N-acetyltransferase
LSWWFQTVELVLGMPAYKALGKQRFELGDFTLVPIRMEDRYKIMEWRNEQIYHLRQTSLLTQEDQDQYFKTSVAGLFESEFPNQLLFSFLQNETCIGYGGLVHINWKDRHTELSFIMDTQLEKDHFESIWKTYLKLVESVAFSELELRKLYTYAFDLRPHLYPIFEDAGYIQDARLRDHVIIDNQYFDVVIHSKINPIQLTK